MGAGFAGLTAAIECHRKGHDVVVLESFPQLKILGDIISFGPNSGRIFQKWEGVEEQLDPLCHNTDHLNFVTWDGHYLIAQRWDEEANYGKKFNGHRGEIHEIVFNHAKARGIDIRLGQKVIDYFEDEKEAGVLARNVTTGAEERFTADVVFAADGVRSEGRKIVLGYEDKPISSGYAIFRSWFDSTKLTSPLTDHLWKNGDTHWGWIGPDVHFLAASLKGGKDFSWVCTHKVIPYYEIDTEREKKKGKKLTSTRTTQILKNPGPPPASSKTASKSSKDGTQSYKRLSKQHHQTTSWTGSSSIVTPYLHGSAPDNALHSLATPRTLSCPHPFKAHHNQWKMELRSPSASRNAEAPRTFAKHYKRTKRFAMNEFSRRKRPVRRRGISGTRPILIMSRNIRKL